MTVCVAAICEVSGTSLGASDRMLTAGDVQFQPPTPKCFPLTTSIVLMTAGDMLVQAELVSEMNEQVLSLLSADPKPDWLKVHDMAVMYADMYAGLKAKRAEADILKPLGLTLETFIARQNQLSQQLVSQIATELIGKNLPGVEAILAGIDRTGAHIYTVANGTVNCHDAVGFAAIGSGWYHANSQLMFARHGKQASFGRTLALIYTAKKRAEVAPGVGAETDMFAIRGLGSHFEVGDHVMAEFQTSFAKAVIGHAEVDAIAQRTADDYITQLLRPPQPAGQEKQQTPDGETPVDGHTGGEEPTPTSKANPSTKREAKPARKIAGHADT